MARKADDEHKGEDYSNLLVAIAKRLVEVVRGLVTDAGASLGQLPQEAVMFGVSLPLT